MIAHRIERKSGKDAYGRLACYVLDVGNSQDPKVFDRLASYVVDHAGGGERVVGTQITNCSTEDFELAVAEIEATQALNTRAKGDKSYHLVISFPEGERPTLEQLRDIEAHLCAAIGYAEHQRISAIHDDTDNLHVHVAINKVHPKTRRCVEPYYDKKKLMEACIELEAKHGLMRVNHGVDAEKRRSQGVQALRQWVDENAKEHVLTALATATAWEDLHQAFAAVGLEIRPHGAGLVIGPPGDRVRLKASDVAHELSIKSLGDRFGQYIPPGPAAKAVEPDRAYTPAPEENRKPTQGEQKMDAHAAKETLRQWVDENAKEHLTTALTTAKTWEELHQSFAAVGLEIRPYGAGLVIGPPGDRVTLKASDVARDLSIKSLVDKFGQYVPPGPAAKTVIPDRRYIRAPTQRSPEAQALWKRYEAERQAALDARRSARETTNTDLTKFAENLKEHFKGRRAAIRGLSYIRGDERFDMMGDLRAERAQTWSEYRRAAHERRDHAFKDNPLPTWQEFLQREATAGDEQALAALREKVKSTRRLAADILTAADVSAARTVIDKRHTTRAQANGDMVYVVHDGGRLTDRKEEVRMDSLSTGAAFLALSLAVERFGGQPLMLDGSEEFKRAVVEVSALTGFEVRFADPDLEAARELAVREREIAERNRPAPGTAQAYIAQRNEAREHIPSIPTHRLWQAADAGKFEYEGKRQFADGSEAVLLRRDEEIFVKPLSAAQVAMASHWPRGKPLYMDKRGRFSMKPPSSSRQPELNLEARE